MCKINYIKDHISLYNRLVNIYNKFTFQIYLFISIAVSANRFQKKSRKIRFRELGKVRNPFE